MNSPADFDWRVTGSLTLNDIAGRFDWQAAAQQSTSGTHAHSPEISPYLFKNALVFPKHGLNMNQNVTEGIKHMKKKCSLIYNPQIPL